MGRAFRWLRSGFKLHFTVINHSSAKEIAPKPYAFSDMTVRSRFRLIFDRIITGGKTRIFFHLKSVNELRYEIHGISQVSQMHENTQIYTEEKHN